MAVLMFRYWRRLGKGMGMGWGGSKGKCILLVRSYCYLSLALLSYLLMGVRRCFLWALVLYETRFLTVFIFPCRAHR
jgi:hypothetical protein